jgi:hypothetical protein
MTDREVLLVATSTLATGRLMADRSSAQDLSGREAAAAYIAALSGDLAVIARSHGLHTLGYLLDMAKLEADNVSRGVDGGRTI